MQLSVLVTLFSCGFSLIFHFGLKKLQFFFFGQKEIAVCSSNLQNLIGKPFFSRLRRERNFMINPS